MNPSHDPGRSDESPSVLSYADNTTGLDVRRVRRSGIVGFFAAGADKPILQDAAEIDRLYRQSRISILIAISVGYGLMYTCRLGMSVVKKPLIDGAIFNADELGRIGSYLLWGYAFGRLVNGFLADHANLRKFFTLGMLLTAGANLVMCSSTAFFTWAVLWGLNGWFQGFGAPSSIVTIAHWFRADERGRAYGIFSLSHSLGEGITLVGTSALVAMWGWEAGFIGPGLLCTFAAIFIWLMMRDRPPTLGLPVIERYGRHGWGKCDRCGYDLTGLTSDRCPECGTPTLDAIRSARAAADGIAQSPARQSQWRVLALPAMWVLCVASAMMYMTRYAIMNWGILYLQEARGYSLMQAGRELGVNTAAGILGCVAYGFISDKLFAGKRPPVTLIFGVLEVLSLFVIFFAPPGHPHLLTGAFIVYGFTLSGLLAVLGGLFATDIVPKHMVGAAVGLIGVFSYAAAGIQDRVSGSLIHHGDKIEVIRDTAGAIIKEIHHYDFSKPIVFWIGSSVLSLILASVLWRVRARE